MGRRLTHKEIQHKEQIETLEMFRFMLTVLSLAHV